MKIHADDCPALQKNLRLPLDVVHACTCTAQDALAELVAAAEVARKCLRQFGDYDDAAILDAALKPFREEPK